MRDHGKAKLASSRQISRERVSKKATRRLRFNDVVAADNPLMASLWAGMNTTSPSLRMTR